MSEKLNQAYFKEVLSNVPTDELVSLQQDLSEHVVGSPWSSLITEIMERAKLIADADKIIARFDVAA